MKVKFKFSTDRQDFKDGSNHRKKKQSEMRVETISKRDMDLLAYLCLGPADARSIARRFFPRRDEVGRNLDGLHPVDHPSVYARTRLLQFKKQGYVTTQEFGKKKTMIVAIQFDGACIVAEEGIEEMDNVKCSLPREGEVDHDIMVASSLRKIVLEEARAKGLYEVTGHYTEQFLRRNSGISEAKSKGLYFPDFVVSIYTPASGEKFWNFEIDGGSMGRLVTLKKLASFRGNSVVITRKVERMQKLINDLRKDMNNPAKTKGGVLKLPETVLFALWEDILRNGCKGAPFTDLRSGNVVKFPL